MTTSELIGLLSRLIDTFGDTPVRITDEMGELCFVGVSVANVYDSPRVHLFPNGHEPKSPAK